MNNSRNSDSNVIDRIENSQTEEISQHQSMDLRRGFMGSHSRIFNFYSQHHQVSQSNLNINNSHATD